MSVPLFFWSLLLIPCQPACLLQGWRFLVFTGLPNFGDRQPLPGSNYLRTVMPEVVTPPPLEVMVIKFGGGTFAIMMSNTPGPPGIAGPITAV
jgi:hypothetical protein